MAGIAAELGLSRMTVSSVLNGMAEKRRISPETALRVKEYIVSRGYVPRRHAQELRRGRTGSVGILHSGNLYSHLTHACNRMCSLFSESPRRLELMVSPRENILEGIKELISRSVSFLVWVQTSGASNHLRDPVFRTYLLRTQPVIYNYLFPSEEETRALLDEGYFLIGVDRTGGYLQLAEFLKKLGHRRVASPDARVSCMEEAFASAGLELLNFSPAYPADMSFEQRGRLSARASLPLIKNGEITALCYGDDAVAGFALSELAENGISVPDDVTVTGFDGLEIAGAFHPRLITLRMPVEEMVGRVREIISGNQKNRKHLLRMELVEGRSHGEAKR